MDGWDHGWRSRPCVKAVTTRMRILIVEDEERLAMMILQALVGEGHAPSVVHTGDEALDHITCVDFDAVVLDVMLPGMSGLELMEELALRRMAHRVILVTGRNDKAIKDRAAALGAAALLEKPIDFDALMTAIEGPADRSHT